MPLICERIGDGHGVAGFIAKQQPAAVQPAFQKLREHLRFADFGYAQALRLLRRFDGVGAQPLQIDAPRHCAFGDHRNQSSHAELGRFLRQKFGGRFLDRRKRQPEIRNTVLDPRLNFANDDAAASGDIGQHATPLPVPAVEQQCAIAIPHPHDMQKVMQLRIGGADPCARMQRLIREKPQLPADIFQFAGFIRRLVAGHGRTILSTPIRLQHA